MRGFDVNKKLTFEGSKWFKNNGYEFVFRYVGREKMSPSIDIDKVEGENILKAGLKLAIVQHCPPAPGIIPLKVTGDLWGKNAALFSQSVGIKAGTTVCLDLEDVNITYKDRQQDIIDFCNTWYDQVVKIYQPCVYVGFNTWLTGDQLYGKLKFQLYWKSFSNVPDIPNRGYSIVQKRQIIINGIALDPDEMYPDKKGNSPIFMSQEIDWKAKYDLLKTDLQVLVDKYK